MLPKNFHEAATSGFLPYILEENGNDKLCTTKAAKINASIKDFKSLVRQGKNPNYYIDSVLAKHGLSEDMLTDAECNRIMRAINGN